MRYLIIANTHSIAEMVARGRWLHRREWRAVQDEQDVFGYTPDQASVLVYDYSRTGVPLSDGKLAALRYARHRGLTITEVHEDELLP